MVRTPSLASRKEGAEPPDDAGGPQLAGHPLPFQRRSVQDSSSCPTSLNEEGNSSESKL